MTLRVNVRSTSKDPRPVNLDIGTIDLPVTAYASITHRVTGVLMFFASFLMLWALDMSLTSEASFNEVAAMLASPLHVAASDRFTADPRGHRGAGPRPDRGPLPDPDQVSRRYGSYSDPGGSLPSGSCSLSLIHI